MFKLLALQRPGAIAAIAALWLLSRTPLAPARPALAANPDPSLGGLS